jgi:hypothetical protein
MGCDCYVQAERYRSFLSWKKMKFRLGASSGKLFTLLPMRFPRRIQMARLKLLLTGVLACLPLPEPEASRRFAEMTFKRASKA